MGGDISAEIKEPEKLENIAEKGYGQLMEIYVPVENGDGSVFGVIETYVSLDRINADSAKANSSIFSTMFLGSSAVVFAILFVFMQLQKNAIGPILKIQNATKQIADGNLDISIDTKAYDEIKTLSQNVETMAQDLKKQRNELVKAEKLTAIGELAARLSHDLRNPLHVIKSTLAMIKDDCDDKINDRTISDFQRIDTAIRRMSHQIESVLDFVSIKSLTVNTCSLDEILRSTLAKITVPTGVKIHVSDNNVMAYCDSTKMEVVLENLIMNAIQAVGNDGTIDVRISEDDQKAIIEVQDSGSGISQNDLPRIFEPLFTTKQKGTGLGLATCKNIVEQHGGTIDVKTKPTIFKIIMPKRAAPTFGEQKEIVVS